MTQHATARWLAVCGLAVGLAAGALAAEPEATAGSTVTVQGTLPSLTVRARRPLTAASSQIVRDRDFLLRPRTQPSDILKVTPGLLVTQHAGGGKANQYFLRGFDADHGSDLALLVDGMPVNMVSHAHGQGYADLHFVIPEVIEQIEVRKGPYFVEDGDFATAGSVHLRSRRAIEQNLVSVSAGSFNTRRYLALAGASTGAWQPLVAAEAYQSDGPFDHPERLQRYNLFVKQSYLPSPGTQLSLTAMSYGGGWNGSGQIPLREVQAGRLSRFGSVDPTEGGNSQRHSVSLAYAVRPDEDQDTSASAYLISYRLALFSNFTFFARDPVNGDQIEQDDNRTVAGFRAEHRRRRDWAGLVWETRVGVTARTDVIHNQLHEARARKRVSTRIDADIREGILGIYLEEQVSPLDWLRVVVGGRGDYAGFDVTDRLEVKSATAPRTSGVRQDMRVSPKASAVITPWNGTDVYLNYGHGFHSNDARGVVRSNAPVTPLTRAIGYEAGVRTRLWDRLDLAAAAWRLDLDSEIVWVGDEGTTEPRGETRREGVDLEARHRLTSWLWADADVTLSRAVFTKNAGNTNAVALAPLRTITGGLSARHPSGVTGSLRATHIGDRPATEDRVLIAQGFTVFDLAAGYRYRDVEVTLGMENLLDTEWRDAQFANTSRLPGEPAEVQDLHFVPGTPRRVQGGVRVYF